MMSNGELENVLLYLDDMEVWANSVREEAKNRALRGEEFNFFKLVAGREGNRKWENEKWIRDRLGRDAIKEVTLSPSEIEKVFPKNKNKDLWDELSQQITRSQAKPVLVSVNDKRDRFVLSDEFENIE